MTEKGRPLALTPVVQETILQAIREGNSYSTASALSGISKRTFFDWQSRANTGEEPFFSFFAQVESARAEAEANAVSNIMRAGQDGSWQASAWYLERTNYQEWGRKDKLIAEIDSSHTERIEVNIEHQMSSDLEARELLKQLYERQRLLENGT